MLAKRPHNRKWPVPSRTKMYSGLVRETDSKKMKYQWTVWHGQTSIVKEKHHDKSTNKNRKPVSSQYVSSRRKKSGHTSNIFSLDWLVLLLMEEVRPSWGNGSLSHYLRGFYTSGFLAGCLPSTVVNPPFQGSDVSLLHLSGDQKSGLQASQLYRDYNKPI